MVNPRIFQSRKAPTHILVGVIAAGILASVAACDTNDNSDDSDQYVAVCVRHDGTRVPDDQCGLDDNGDAVARDLMWDYIAYSSLRSGYVLPGYYSRVNVTNINVIHHYPSGGGRTVSRGVPAAGGNAATVRSNLAKANAGSSSVKRGGFGVTGRGASSDSGVSRSAGS